MDNLIQNIKNCKNCKIGEKGSRFHMYSESGKRDFMFIMQNPAENANEWERGKSDKANIKNFQEGLIKWLSEKNEEFSTEFFELLKDSMLISFDERKWEGPFLKNFYITDAVKCISKTTDIDEEVTTNCQGFLEKEISSVKPKLIFAFSKRTWEMLNKLYENKIEPVGKNYKFEKPMVTKDHGRLFKIRDGKTRFYVIPLNHFAGQTFNNTLRNSYFDYLKGGLKKYKNRKISKNKRL